MLLAGRWTQIARLLIDDVLARRALGAWHSINFVGVRIVALAATHDQCRLICLGTSSEVKLVVHGDLAMTFDVDLEADISLPIVDGHDAVIKTVDSCLAT